jgi:CHASE2 domain-containing sensor protein
MHRKHLIKDSIGATIGVFLVMALFAYIPFNFKILDPLKHGLKDFEFSDIYYTKIKKEAPIDTNVIIVNIGYNNRYQILQQLQKIKQYQPAVIGLDIQFLKHKDPTIDGLLEAEINATSNIVMASYLAEDPHNHGHYRTEIETSALNLPKASWGYINFIGKDEQYPVRYFNPIYQHTKTPHDAFGVAIAKKYNPQAYDVLVKRHKKVETINYSRRQEQYHVIDVNELEDSTADFGFMRGKIVLMGFLGPDVQTKVIEENRFTPMNPKFSGKAYPDMYGVVIHANIISSVLEQSYINKLPTWISMVLAFIICWVHVYFFTKFYVQHHKFFHLVTKIIQLLTFVLMIYLSFFFLSKFGLKIDMAPILGGIALSVDVLYFYDGFATWMKEKFGYKTVFGHH